MMRSAWAAVLLIAAACAQLEPVPAEKPEFELNARLAARYRDESFSGNVAWRHARGSDEMLISSPVGAGVARIVREGETVVLTTSEPSSYRARDAETLTEKVLGFRLPLTGLADWVRGRPSPGAPYQIDRSPDGRVKALRQRGWDVQYLEFQDELPSRLRLVYPGIELRLAISEWK